MFLHFLAGPLSRTGPPFMFVLLLLSLLFVLLFVQLPSACAACSYSIVLAAFFFCLYCCFYFCVLLLLLCAAFPVVCPAFAAAFGSPLINPPLPLSTFQTVCTAFVPFLCCFCHCLLLLDAGFSRCVCCFSCCSCLLLLPLAASCFFVAVFAALLLLLLWVLSSRRPLKSQSLPAFDLPKCLLCCCRCCFQCFPVVWC